MPRRIDVELTSARDDGTWTWRAAGARQPKGVVSAELLYEGAKVGDVLSAEADFDVDGITITSVTPPKRKAGRTDLLELTSDDEDFTPVITNWNEKKGGRDRDPYGEKAPRGDRPGGGGGGGGGRGGPGGPGGGGGRGPRPTADWRARVTPPQPERTERSGGRGGERRGGPGGGRDRDRDRTRSGAEGAEAGLGTGGPTTDRRGGSRPDGGANRGRPGRAPAGDRTGGGGDRPRPKRLSPGNTHRTAVLESLSPEQRPVAEQVLRGGIPAVRKAIEEQNTTAKAAGQPEIKPGPLVAMAEDLLPRLKTAEWHDRAEAAMADVDEIGLRDLRSVVSGADAAARDDETRTLASQLREALERRLKKQSDDWIGEITGALDDGRLVRALRVASRPPDPSMRFPAEVAQKLAGAASEAMAADTPPERWAALLEAVAASPVRTTVKPAGLPENPGETLLNAARQQAGRIPALTTLLGISMPPPPGPVRRIPPKPTQGQGQGGRGPKPGGGAPRPPAGETPPAESTREVPADEPVNAGETPPGEIVEASAAPESPAVLDDQPAPPTPLHDDGPSEIPTPPEATDPVPPVEPSPSPAADDVEAPSDASVVTDGSGPGAGEG